MSRSPSRFLSFLRSCGVSEFFGIPAHEVANFWFSTPMPTIVDMATKLAITYGLATAIMKVVKGALALMKEWLNGKSPVERIKAKLNELYWVTIPTSISAVYQQLQDYYRSLTMTLYGVGSRCLSFLREHMLTIVVALTGLAGLWTLYGYISSSNLFSEDQESGTPHTQMLN